MGVAAEVREEPANILNELFRVSYLSDDVQIRPTMSVNNPSSYLEVSHHDEAGSTDPGGGEAGRVEDTVLVLLYHVSVAQQPDQHH